jgi:hypothetical protein
MVWIVEELSWEWWLSNEVTGLSWELLLFLLLQSHHVGPSDKLRLSCAMLRWVGFITFEPFSG